MQSWVKCSGCGAQIEPTANACPICLRPRSRPEIMRGIIELKQGPVRRRRALLRAIAALGLAVGAVLAVWDQRARLAPHVRAFKSFAVTWLGLDQYPFKTAPEPAAPQSAPPAAEAPSLVAAPPPSAALPAEADISTAAAGQPARPDYWALRGHIYDLYSLKPVAQAALTFTSRATGEVLSSRTNAAGDFSLRLPRIAEGGYDITVRHPRYLDNFLEENSPPYKTMSPDRRQRAGSLLLQTEVLHVPYLPLPDEDRPQLELVLLPR
jgi:hypothetical protein